MEGVYQDLAGKITKGYRTEGNCLIAGDRKVTFKPAEFGLDVFLGSLRLGNTSDNFFLVYLTELFEKRDQESLDRLILLAKDNRTIQATELQMTITSDNNEFRIGKRDVRYSTRYFECSCPDWKYRKRLGGCKHIAALRLLDV